jgi:hypothetical protein
VRSFGIMTNFTMSQKGPSCPSTSYAGGTAGGGRQFLRCVLLAMALTFAAGREAKAYTDPGAGILIWQMLLAGFVSGLFYLRRARRWLGQLRKNHQNEPEH